MRFSEISGSCTQSTKRGSSGVYHCLRQLTVVSGDVAQSPSGTLLDGRVKFFEAYDEGVQCTGVDDGLREFGGVLGDGAEHERGGLFVETVLLAQTVDQLREDLVSDNGLGEIVTEVGETAQRQCGALLDARHVVKQQRAQQLHDTRVLHDFYILRSGGQFSHRLHERNARFLVLFKDLENR